MFYTNIHIVETYSGLFEGLSSIDKIELIENVSKSLKTESSKKKKQSFISLLELLAQTNQQKKWHQK